MVELNLLGLYPSTNQKKIKKEVIQIVKGMEMKWIKMNNLTWFASKKSNNVEYQQIKMNQLFGLDWKSLFKTNSYLIFYLSKWSKNEQNVPKCPLFNSIW